MLSFVAAACHRTAPTSAGREISLVFIASTPAQRAADVAALPPCGPIAATPADWPVVRLTAVAGTMRLPAPLAGVAEAVPSNAEQSWSDSTLGRIVIQRDDDAGLSSGFMLFLEPGPSTIHVDEGACAHPFDGRLSRVRRTFSTTASHPTDTIFIATTDVPLGGNLQLGAGVMASTRAGRESLLSALASLRLQEP